MDTRPQPVSLGLVLLVLLSLLNFISPFLPTDYPTIVLFLGGALGVVGLLAAAGLWMLMFAALGWALYTRARVPEAEPVQAAAGLR